MANEIIPPARGGSSAPKRPRTKKVNTEFEDLGDVILQKLMQNDRKKDETLRPVIVGFTIALIAFIFVVVMAIIFYVTTTTAMHNTYIKNVENVILSQKEIRSAADWENLPEEQRKSKLREQYNTIIQYYTNSKPIAQKMTNTQVIDSFNELWKATSKTSVDFFFIVAYIKVATNFNPNYDRDQKKGIAAFYLKTIEDAINLPLVRDDASFFTVYRGSGTAFDPADMMKVLVARTNNLKATFRNREDWVMFSLFTNEFDIISKYWQDGQGTIPDDVYKNGNVAEALKYYYAFKNFKIPILE